MFNTIDEVFSFVYSRRATQLKKITDRHSKSLSFSKDIEILFDRLDNPQTKTKVIHVAGTSGKGSTCNFISHILTSQGFKVGTSVSPYIEKFNERLQINNIPVSEELFLQYFNEIYPALQDLENELDHKFSTFVIIKACVFWAFWKEGVDYSVVEVGMGGRLDATNVPNYNKICVLNSIGLDHQEFLGDTLELIAGEKAGIIQKGSLAVALSQSIEVNKIFQDKADEENVDLEFIFPEFDFKQPVTRFNNDDGRPSLVFEYNDSELESHTFELNQIGDYQASNCALALRAVEIVADRDDWEIDWEKIVDELKKTTFNGRFQFYDLPNQNILILDGAHNPQKMQGFANSIAKYFPNQKFNWVLGFKDSKDVSEIVDQILANKNNIGKIVLTEFDVNIPKLAEQVIVSKLTQEIAQCLDSKGYRDYVVEPDVKKAINTIKESKEDYIITGSLYLVGNALGILKA
jgi:dihydrofolate synthase / folylpolyglutamate synthase